MNTSTRQQELERVCRARGLPLTIQRRVILDALLQSPNHPTADQIYGGLRRRAPELSRVTVYRTLETLVQIGIVSKVCHPGAAARYDSKTQRHHHLVCLQCGKIIDLEDPSLDHLPLPAPGHLGYDITDYSIQFRGICRDCRATVAEARGPGIKRSRNQRGRRSQSQRRET